MLVKLTSSTSGDLILFAEHAHYLFNAIGKECTAQGVFLTDELPGAIAVMRRIVSEERQMVKSVDEDEQPKANTEKEDDQKEIPEHVSLRQRATPLIRLMEFTEKEGGFLIWKASADF